MNESDAIAKAKAGDPASFASLYDNHVKNIYGFLYARTLHKQTAEDLTSEVFFKALNKLSQFKEDQYPFGAWLYGIARNRLIDHYRKIKPNLDLETVYDLKAEDNPEIDTDQTLKKEQIAKLLSGLSPKHRQIVTLRLWEGLTHKEIADILSISEASSKTEFSRAVKTLQKQFGPLIAPLLFSIFK